jgi:hypothetical protein
MKAADREVVASVVGWRSKCRINRLRRVDPRLERQKIDMLPALAVPETRKTTPSTVAAMATSFFISSPNRHWI